MNETPDIEIEADRMEAEVVALAEMNAQEDAARWEDEHQSVADEEDRDSGINTRLIDDMPEDPYAGINSCDALRIIDGVSA